MVWYSCSHYKHVYMMVVAWTSATCHKHWCYLPDVYLFRCFRQVLNAKYPSISWKLSANHQWALCRSINPRIIPKQLSNSPVLGFRPSNVLWQLRVTGKRKAHERTPQLLLWWGDLGISCRGGRNWKLTLNLLYSNYYHSFLVFSLASYEARDKLTAGGFPVFWFMVEPLIQTTPFLNKCCTRGSAYYVLAALTT